MGDVLGNSYDMRGGQSKKSDEAGKAISSMGKGEFHPVFLISLRHHRAQQDKLTLATGKGETVPGTSINADQQTQNQNSGTADHLDMAFRKQE
jgi:hypothetical protein